MNRYQKAQAAASKARKDAKKAAKQNTILEMKADQLTIEQIAEKLLNLKDTAIEGDFFLHGYKIDFTVKKAELMGRKDGREGDATIIPTFEELLDVCIKHNAAGTRYGFEYKGCGMGIEFYYRKIEFKFCS